MSKAIIYDRHSKQVYLMGLPRWIREIHWRVEIGRLVVAHDWWRIRLPHYHRYTNRLPDEGGMAHRCWYIGGTSIYWFDKEAING